MTFLDKNFTGKTVSVHNKNQAVELPLNGRDGRFSTGRKTTNPYRDRQFKIFEKSSTGRARHPVDGCRRAVVTATGGSPMHDDARRLGAGGVSAFPAASTTSEGLYLHGKHHLARAAPSARSLRAALGLPQLLSPRIFRPLPSLPFYCLPARLVALSTSPTAYRPPDPAPATPSPISGDTNE
ncbi:hypothetical protein C8J57DRAFT_1241473 [Mycena rebaudengoi]|nr:hypothetical protein C8J57DRAFT_1241473 [Mycena rebaudengoi]